MKAKEGIEIKPLQWRHIKEVGLMDEYAAQSPFCRYRIEKRAYRDYVVYIDGEQHGQHYRVIDGALNYAHRHHVEELVFALKRMIKISKKDLITTFQYYDRKRKEEKRKPKRTPTREQVLRARIKAKRQERRDRRSELHGV